MQHESPVAIVQAWQEAVNRQDVARLVALSSPEIELVGPRGAGCGLPLLRDWLGRAGLHLAPQRVFVRGNVVVVAHHGVWHADATGAVGGAADFATCFCVGGGRVARFARYDTLDRALAAASLTHADEIPLTERGRGDTSAGDPARCC
jgi:ketosteroid isomerase-like protein